MFNKIILSLSLTTTITAIFLISQALGHSWFDPNCCDEGDCIKVACDTINGNLYNGVPADRVLPSQDTDCYACGPFYLNGILNKIRCLYIQMVT